MRVVSVFILLLLPMLVLAKSEKPTRNDNRITFLEKHWLEPQTGCIYYPYPSLWIPRGYTILSEKSEWKDVGISTQSSFDSSFSANGFPNWKEILKFEKAFLIHEESDTNNQTEIFWFSYIVGKSIYYVSVQTEENVPVGIKFFTHLVFRIKISISDAWEILKKDNDSFRNEHIDQVSINFFGKENSVMWKFSSYNGLAHIGKKTILLVNAETGAQLNRMSYDEYARFYETQHLKNNNDK